MRARLLVLVLGAIVGGCGEGGPLRDDPDPDALPLPPPAGDDLAVSGTAVVRDAGLPPADRGPASHDAGIPDLSVGDAPPPAADAPPPPAVAPAVPSDFSGVVWLHSDVSAWAETATLGRVTIGGGRICLPYDRATSWPGVDHVNAFVNANPWIFVQRDGTWYAATWEWMRHGQTCKNLSSVAGDHIKRSPLLDFTPQSGQWYGLMVSGLARDATRNRQERTQVVMFQWP